MNKKIRLGILGGGGDSLIGVLHRVASSMFGRYEIVGGVFNPAFKENIAFAKQIGIDTTRVYEDFETHAHFGPVRTRIDCVLGQRNQRNCGDRYRNGTGRRNGI